MASITTMRADLEEFDAGKDALEGFINYPRSIIGAEVAVSFREEEGGIFRVSFRSKGRVDVSEVAARFGGGGHRNAAGCSVPGTLAEVKRKVYRGARSRAYVTGGVIVLDKPGGITSFDAVRAVGRILREKKCGHAGTLDPMATGVLPICVGAATKIAGYLTEDEKEYEAAFSFGVATDTGDADREAGGDPPGGRGGRARKWPPPCRSWWAPSCRSRRRSPP